MTQVTTPSRPVAEANQTSPDYVRISMAAAMALGLKPGKMLRNCGCG